MATRFSTDTGNTAAETEEFSASARGSYNTIRRAPKSAMRYSTRMTMSFAMTAVMTAAILVAVLAFVWEGQFQTYTRANMQRMAQQTADGIAQRYNEDKTWSTSVLDFARATSDSMPEVGMRITNDVGEVLYDDTNGGVMTTARGARNAKLALPLAEDSVVSADVFDDTGDERVVVGTVTLWSVSSDAPTLWRGRWHGPSSGLPARRRRFATVTLPPEPILPAPTKSGASARRSTRWRGRSSAT